MKQQEVFKKIGGIIREINEQYEYLQAADGVFNDLELELLIANSHFLTDHIEILRKIAAHTAKTQLPVAEELPIVIQPVIQLSTPKEKSAAEPRYFEPELEPEKQPAIELEAAPDTHTFEFEIDNRVEPEAEIELEPKAVELETEEEPALVEREPVTIRYELTLEDLGEDWDEDDDEDIDLQPEPVEIEEEQPETIAKIIPEPEPIAATPEPNPVLELSELIAEIPKPATATASVTETHTQIMVAEEQIITLNQRISAQMSAGRIADQLHGQPISDLKGAITLNDKMLYVKELFNGYSLAYSETVDLLNRAKSFEEAEAYLKNSYATKNNWADKQVTADKFYALLQRRYI